jgi:hypothetical protein
LTAVFGNPAATGVPQPEGTSMPRVTLRSGWKRSVAVTASGTAMPELTTPPNAPSVTTCPAMTDRG